MKSYFAKSALCLIQDQEFNLMKMVLVKHVTIIEEAINRLGKKI